MGVREEGHFERWVACGLSKWSFMEWMELKYSMFRRKVWKNELYLRVERLSWVVRLRFFSARKWSRTCLPFSFNYFFFFIDWILVFRGNEWYREYWRMKWKKQLMNMITWISWQSFLDLARYCIVRLDELMGLTHLCGRIRVYCGKWVISFFP